MGGSNSTLTITDGFASILSDQPVSAEVLNQLLANTLTNTEMQKALPLSLLRKLRHYYTHNFAAVLHKCIAEVSTMSERRNKANESSTGDAGLTETAVNAFLTAMQVLRRLLPVALESCDTIIDEEQTQLREHHVSEASQTSPADDSHPRGGDVAPNPTLSGSIPARTLATQQFLKLFFEEGRTCNDANLDERFPLLPKQEQLSDATTALPTNLGSHLVCALVECCFIRGLTLRTTRAIPSTPVPSLAHGEVDNRFVWSDGIGSNEPLDYTRTRSSASRVSTRMNATRRDVLNTLLSLVSSPLYHQCGYRDTLFMEPLLSASSVPLAPTLAASMLNTIFNYIPYGSLPYTSYFVHEEEGVVVASARLLCATMCYVGIPLDARKGSELANGSPTMAHSNPAVDDSSTAEHGNSHSAEQDDPTVGTSGAPERLTRDDHQSSPDAPPNVAPGQQVRIVHCIRKLVHDITLSESKFIAECFIDVIGLRAYSNQTYLPDSQRNFTSHDEFMMLLWKLIDLSPSVSTQFGCNTRSLSYLVPVLDYGLDARNSANYVHRLQLVLFMLLRLSEVRSFGVHCNKVIGEFIPFPFPKLPATSTYHDLIVVSMCLILEASESALVPLMPSCSVVITNLAPYITQLGNCASLKLTNVFVKASNRCLRSTDASDRGLSAVNQNVMVNTCEAIASLLQYQESGSRYLLASLVDHRHVVNRLRDAYIVNRTKSFSIPMTSFLIATLDAAVSVAVPFVAVEFNPSFSATAEDSSSSGSQSPRSAAEIAETAAATAIHVAAVAEKLTSITLVGMLPTPHPLVTRKFHQTRLVENWATITFWANLYTRSAAGWMGDRASVKLLHFS